MTDRTYVPRYLHLVQAVVNLRTNLLKSITSFNSCFSLMKLKFCRMQRRAIKLRVAEMHELVVNEYAISM